MTTATPDGSRILSQPERAALGVAMCRDLQRQFKEEDAWIMAGRPAVALGVDVEKRAKTYYEKWLETVAKAAKPPAVDDEPLPPRRKPYAASARP